MTAAEKEKIKTAKDLGKYILRYKTTVRKAAAHFKLSKSTAHVRITELKRYDIDLYDKVHAILKDNWDDRAYRGARGLWGNKIKHSKKEVLVTNEENPESINN